MVASAFAWTEWAEEEDVLVLTDENFNEAINTHQYLLVEFYAPWCGHCKELAPEYAKAASRLKLKGLRIAKIDAQQSPEATAEYKVTSYPTIKFFESGIASEYDGGRNANSIVSWVSKKAGPTFITVETVAELKPLLAANSVVAVFFATSSEVNSGYFEKAAANTEGLEFVVCKDPAAKETYSLKKDGAILLFKDFDEPKSEYLGPASPSALSSFLDKKKRRSALEFNDEVVDLIFKKNKPSLMIFRSDSVGALYQSAISVVGKQFKDDLVVTYCDLSSPANTRLSEYIGISPSEMPLSFILKSTDEAVEKFKGSSNLSEEALVDLVERWKRGELKPHLKSAVAPEDPYDGPVRILVGTNFAEVVYDTTKDVLVEFYAPWCGHCKTLLPEFEKAAEFLQDNYNIILAKVDSTENEIEGHPVTSYPVVKFFPKDNKAGVSFDGTRDFQGIIDYIKKKTQGKRDEL